MTVPPAPLLIFGAGGLAREVAFLAGRLGRVVTAFVDRSPASLHGIPVVTLDEAASRWPGAEAAIAIGDATLRRRVARDAIDAGLAIASLIDPSTIHAPSVSFGTGTIVLPGAVFTADIRLGQHVLVNPGVTVAHDVAIGDYASLSPGVRIAGNVAIEDDAFIGIGATIVNGTPARPITVGRGACVGGGTVVIRDVPRGVTVVGSPARPLSTNA